MSLINKLSVMYGITYIAANVWKGTSSGDRGREGGKVEYMSRREGREREKEKEKERTSEWNTMIRRNMS